MHDDPTDPVETGASAAALAGANLVTLTATITDGDGDTDTATRDISGGVYVRGRRSVDHRVGGDAVRRW